MRDDPILGGKPPPAAPASFIRSPYSPVSDDPPTPAALASGDDRPLPPPDSPIRPRDRGPQVLLAAPVADVSPGEDRALFNRLGLQEPRLEQLDDGSWRFSGSRARPNDPSVLRRYDARATTPAEAIRAVREQIEHDGFATPISRR
jgi:hypothetical protein